MGNYRTRGWIFVRVYQLPKAMGKTVNIKMNDGLSSRFPRTDTIGVDL